MSESYVCSKCGGEAVVIDQTAGRQGQTGGTGGVIPQVPKRKTTQCKVCGHVELRDREP